MSGPRASWFVGDLSNDELDLVEDPFDCDIEQIGEVIDLSDRSAVLRSRVQQLLSRESFLYQKSVTCAIKDHDETSCHGCPVSQAHDLQSHLGALCRVGREQEEVLTELVALSLDSGDERTAI